MVNSGLVVLMNSASRLLCREKPTTALPPAHDPVFIQSLGRGGSLDRGFVVSVLEREREREPSNVLVEDLL